MDFNNIEDMEDVEDVDDVFDDMAEFNNDFEAANPRPDPPATDEKEPERETSTPRPSANVDLKEPTDMTEAQLAEMRSPDRVGNQVQDISSMALVQGLSSGELTMAQTKQCISVMGYAPMNLLDKRVQAVLVRSPSAHPALAKAFKTGTIRPFAMGVSMASMNICCGFMTIFISRTLLRKTIYQMDVNSSGRKHLRDVAAEIGDNMDSLDKKRHSFVLHVAKICKEMGSMSTLLEFGANVDKIVQRLTSMNMDLAATIADVDRTNSRALSKIKVGQEFLLEVVQNSDAFRQMERNIKTLQVDTRKYRDAWEKLVNEEAEKLNKLKRKMLQHQYARDRALKKIELAEQTRPEIQKRIERFEKGVAQYEQLKIRADADRSAEEDLREFEREIVEENRKQVALLDKEQRGNRQNYGESMQRLNEHMAQADTRLRERQDSINASADAAKKRAAQRAQTLAKQAQQQAAFELQSQLRKINAESESLADSIRNKERESERNRASSKYADNGYRKFITTNAYVDGQYWDRHEGYEKVLPNEQARLEGLARTSQDEADRLRVRQEALTGSQSMLKADLISRMNQVQSEAQTRANDLQNRASEQINALREQETKLANRIRDNESALASETQGRLDGQIKKQNALLTKAREMIENRKTQKMLVAQRMFEGAKLRRAQYVDKLETSRTFMLTLKAAAEESRNSLNREVESTRTAMQTAEAEMKMAQTQIQQCVESMESGPRFVVIGEAKKLYLDSAEELEDKKQKLRDYTSRIGYINGMDIVALMSSLSQLQLAVERLPLTLNTLHDSLETAAATFNSEIFRKDLEDFDDPERRDAYVKAMVDRVHAICEVGFQAIDQPARAMMTMNSDAAFDQLKAIAHVEAQSKPVITEVK